jgi:glucan phosphoethanolaminetransferase (alkaline phosphatase superfamily)
MEKEKFQEYLKDRYYDQIDWYDRKAAANQKSYRIYQWGLIILSALTPVLIAIDQGDVWAHLGWVPLASSVLVALMTSALKVFKYQETWINYRTTCETLRKEIHFFEAGTDVYEDAVDKEALFVERVEMLISRENTLWLATQKQEKKKPGAE